MYVLTNGIEYICYECFLGNDCPKLINEMVRCGYLEIVGQIKVNMSTYNIGRFSERFQREFGSET